MSPHTAAPLEKLRYLDDLQVGERFVSATHTLDAAQIKAFASQFSEARRSNPPRVALAQAPKEHEAVADQDAR